MVTKPSFSNPSLFLTNALSSSQASQQRGSVKVGAPPPSPLRRPPPACARPLSYPSLARPSPLSPAPRGSPSPLRRLIAHLAEPAIELAPPSAHYHHHQRRAGAVHAPKSSRICCRGSPSTRQPQTPPRPPARPPPQRRVRPPPPSQPRPRPPARLPARPPARPRHWPPPTPWPRRS